MLDHFGYPALLFSGWRQACWYNLHLTEVWLHKIRQNIIDGCEPLPMIGAMLVDSPPKEENIPESPSVTAQTNAVTSSSSPALAAQPTVAHKPSQLDPPSSNTSSRGKQSRSPSRNGKDKKSK